MQALNGSKNLYHSPQKTSLLENNDKCHFNWSLWGASYIGQAKLLDCNQIQRHVFIAVFPVMILNVPNIYE